MQITRGNQIDQSKCVIGSLRNDLPKCINMKQIHQRSECYGDDTYFFIAFVFVLQNMCSENIQPIPRRAYMMEFSFSITADIQPGIF